MSTFTTTSFATTSPQTHVRPFRRGPAAAVDSPLTLPAPTPAVLCPPTDTFDIYLTRANDRVFLVDFNPYSSATDSLLLPWDTIHALPASGRELPVVAVVEDAVTQPLPSFSHNRYPKDVVELSDGASVAEFAKEWQERLKEAVLDDKEE